MRKPRQKPQRSREGFIKYSKEDLAIRKEIGDYAMTESLSAISKNIKKRYGNPTKNR